jgi:predicted permease
VTASACAALGLGAAIFMSTLVNAVLFAKPPMPDADRLMRVWTSAIASKQQSDVSYPELLDIRSRASSFDMVEGVSRTRLALTTDAGTERLRGESVTPGYFSLIGVEPALGRLFGAAEYTPDSDRPVIISFSLWQRRFGGRSDVLGQPFRTRPTSRQSAGSVRTIVGVMPRGFVGTVDPDVSDFWLPVAHYEPASVLSDRSVRSTWALARLRPGASPAEARSEVAAIAAALATGYPAAYDRVTLTAEPFGETWRERFRLSLYTLLAATGLLLLIACTNIATLLLARLAQRESEMRVRLALGAPRARIVRQLLAESLIIAIVGGIAGLALASVAVRAFASAGVFDLPPYVELGLEPVTVAIGMALVVITGLVFGVLPARVGAGVSIAREAGVRVSQGVRQRQYGRALIVAQVAFTCLLLVGSTLLFRTYQALVGGDLGYRTTGLLRMAVTPDPNAFHDTAARLALAENIKRTFDAYPGVERSATMAGVLQPWFDDAVDVEINADDRLRDVGRHAVGPDYFEVMGMRLMQGRTFGPADRAAGATSGLASQTLAQRLRDRTGRDAIGQRVMLSAPGTDRHEALTIIGVVNDVVYNGPLRPRAADHDLYVPLELGAPGPLSIAIHTRVDPATLIEPLSRELGRLAPTSPQHWISTMQDELGLQYRDAQLYASLSGVFGASATLLALLGIYGVLANSIARRHRELGVRMAVGARGSDIARLVLAEGARMLVSGVTLGTALALGASRLVSGLLYGVGPSDPMTYLVVAALLFLMGMTACIVPSIRAAKLDPLKALRTP